MSYQYEVTVDTDLYDVFRTVATRVLGSQGFRAGLHVANFSGLGVIEYHRNDEVVTLSITEEAHDQRKLTVRSETVDVVSLVVSVVEQSAIGLTASFWAPALGVSRETLIRDVGRALRRIWKRVGSGSGTTKSL
ncbi:hypothetical protein ACFLX9_03760 [Chloroflexota bacterium]